MQRTELTLSDGPGGWVQADIRREDSATTERVWLRLAQDKNGRWQPQGTLYAFELTPENVRTVPLRRILAAIAASDALRDDLAERRDEPAPEPGSIPFLESFSDFVHPEVPLVLERPAGRRLSDEFYGNVAEAYRTAMARGLNPRTAIAEAAEVSHRRRRTLGARGAETWTAATDLARKGQRVRGHIHKRGTTWTVVYDEGRDENGRRIQRGS